MADDDDRHDDDDAGGGSGGGGGDAELAAALAAIRDDPAAAHRTIEALRAEAGDWRRKLRTREQELEEAARATLSEQERAIAEAEARGRAAAEAEHGRRLLEADLRAAAAGKLHDPSDVLRHVDLDELLELDERERGRELEKVVARLLEAKPYLAAPANGAGTANGARTPGARTAPGAARAADTDGSAWLRKAAGRASSGRR